MCKSYQLKFVVQKIKDGVAVLGIAFCGCEFSCCIPGGGGVGCEGIEDGTEGNIRP